MKLASILTVSCGLVALASAAQAQDTFTFDTQPTTAPGSFIFTAPPPPPLFPINYAPKTLAADNNPARIATFSESTMSPISFEFQNTPNYGTNLSGVYLQNVDANPSDVLTITFAQPVTSISLNFSIANFTANNTPDGSLDLNGVMGSGAFNPTSTNFEGTLSFSGAPFTVANLSFLPGASGDNGYAIDNISVTPAASAVPEPGVVALSAASLVMAAGLVRRRRK